MEQVPKIVHERLQAGAKAGVHPDPDMLTAFAENSLNERERVPVLEHLSSCADCREVVVLAQPESALEHVAAVAASPAPARSRGTGRFMLTWAAVAACALVAGLLLRYQMRERQLAQVASRQAAPAMNAGQSASAEQFSAKAQPVAPPPENEVAAKLEPPPVAQESTSEIRADKDSGQAAAGGVLAKPMEKKLGSAAPAAGHVAGAMAAHSGPPIPQSSAQVAVTGSANEVVAVDNTHTQAEVPLQARSSEAQVADAAAAPPPAAQKENKPAAPNASPVAGSSGVGGGLGSVAGFSNQTATLETAQAKAIRKEEMARVSSNYIPTRWMISTDGTTLLRSTDEGRSWDAVNVASNVVFRAVAALGPEVWVGGKSGALYHSSDLGTHWTQVRPSENGGALATDIVSIAFSDMQHVKLTTSEGKVWTTNDGGQSWQTP